ncbi:MAG: phosphatase PAP2 family protein, partial [Bacteroidota bacterium]
INICIMQKIILPFLFILLLPGLFAQGIHPLESAKNHYKDFLSLSELPDPANSHLDEISFPSELYSYALIYVMISPEYLTKKEVEQLKNAMQYPANSSEQTQAELAFLLDWQKRRTAEQEKRAAEVLAPIGYWPHIDLLENHKNYQTNRAHLFYEGRTVLGAQVHDKNYPATAHLLAGVSKDMRLMEFTVKFHLLRPRPYHLEKELKPLAQMSSPSYASGHTLWAYLHAFVWSELVPEKRAEFLDIAYEIGESREIMGIHYPSDEEAARVLAHQMLSLMWENPKFQEDFAKAKAEWE